MPAQPTPSVVDAVILERAAGAVRLVLDRTRGRAPADDPALVETLLDATAPEPARLHAARRLGLDPTAPARALAPLNGRPRVVPAGPESVPLGAGHAAADAAAPLRAPQVPSRAPQAPSRAPRAPSRGQPSALAAAQAVSGTGNGNGTGTRTGSAPAPAVPRPGRHTAPPESRLPTGRLGVGPAVPVLELPRSWAEARTALRFTAEGTPQDPGPRVVHAEELGGIALLADVVAPGAEPPPDVRALETAAATTPWLSATLHAVVATASLRAAAAEINVHHSTLQDRLAHAEHLLGWPIRTPQGRLRLQLALTMRRLGRP
ncbi:helix-turn-helix domain-containing protein [Streptomyces massasporeus]